tara:strand:+ start:97 stop:264 length:168 start_codon:yes stop_codon:yes gene_type:complete
MPHGPNNGAKRRSTDLQRLQEDGDTLSLSGAAVSDGYQIGVGPGVRTITPTRNAS